MNWMTRLSLGLVGSSALFLFLSLSPQSQADPVGPVTTGGEQPWLNFSGTLPPFQTATLLTVPGDQIFVLTMVCNRDVNIANGVNGLEIRQGSTVRMPPFAYNCSPESSFAYGQGNWRMVFPPGSTVVFANFPTGTQYTMDYYAEGFFAAP